MSPNLPSLHHRATTFNSHAMKTLGRGGDEAAKMIPCATQAQQSGMRQAALHYCSQVHVRQYITSSSGDYSCILLGTGQKYELAQTRELFSIFSEQLFKKARGETIGSFSK